MQVPEPVHTAIMRQKCSWTTRYLPAGLQYTIQDCSPTEH